MLDSTPFCLNISYTERLQSVCLYVVYAHLKLHFIDGVNRNRNGGGARYGASLGFADKLLMTLRYINNEAEEAFNLPE